MTEEQRQQEASYQKVIDEMCKPVRESDNWVITKTIRDEAERRALANRWAEFEPKAVPAPKRLHTLEEIKNSKPRGIIERMVSGNF